MAKIGKIEKHNLGPRILQLLTEEGKNSKQIAEILSTEGFKVSQPTISRWIKDQRDSHKDEVTDIIHEHVRTVIPDDLVALEDMERLVLDWAKEEPDTTAERISIWGKITQKVKEFVNAFAAANSEEEPKIISAFVKQCLAWILEDINTKKERIIAMRMVTTIIDTKLKYSGILVDIKAGNIYIQKAKDGRDIPPDETDRRLFIVKKEDNA